MKLYSFLLWLCCLLVAFVQPLTAQTTIGFEGVKFDPISGLGVGYGKAFGVVESGDDEDELTLAGGFVFAITTTHSLTTIVSVSGEGYNSSDCLATNGYDPNFITGWSIKKSDDTNFQFKGIFLKDTGYGGSANGTVTAYKGGVKIGNSVEVDFDGTLNQSFVGNPDFYDIDEVRIEAPDLDIYLDQFMAGPPYSTNVNAPAQVSSIVIEGSPNSSATTMNFLVTFDKPVTNVSVDDFTLMGSGATGIVGSITAQSTSVYRVSIMGLTGEGTVRLNLNGGTNIATINGNITGTLPFTAGESHVVGPCSIENFDQGESDNAASFSNNGQTYQLSGNWKVRKFSPVRGINGSGFHLSGTGQDPMAWKVSTNGFKVGSFNLFLSDDVSGNTLATNGKVTITGKRAGTPVFTQMKSTGFNTDPSVNNGYTFIDLGSDASVVIDELEIQLGGSFQYVDLDNISLCAILNNPPVNSVVPTISGTDKVGNVLSATTGSWTDADGHTLSYTYQWYRADNVGGMNRVPISSATNATYTLTTNDAHKHIQVVVTANDGNGGTTQANSLYTAIQNSAPVNSGVPTISGTALVGNLLITTNGTWSDIDGDGRTYTYQWYRADDVSGTNEVVIAGANSTSYTTTTSDAHKYVKARVRANDGNGGITQANSLYTAIQNSAPVNSVVPTISGTALSGNTLSTTNGTWSDPDGDSPTYTYQWYSADDAIGSNEMVILEANTASYMLVPNDVNKYFRVGVTANDGYGGTKVANSTYVLVLNTAPVLSNLDGDAVTYMEGGTAVLIDAGSNATVTDSDSPDFSGGNMKVAITANRVSDEDVLAIRNEGTGAGQIGVSGNNVTYGGVIIGTWIGGTGANDLVISFNGSAGLASAQALIRNLTYSNSNTTDPATAARTIAVTLNDGDGGTSIPAIVTVQITAVNDAPTLVTTAVNPTFTEDGAAVSLFSGTAISTIEVGQAISKLTLTVANVSDGNQEILKIDGLDVPLVASFMTTGTNGLTLDLSVTGSSVTVQLSKVGGISPTIMAGIVNGITYRNTSANPNTANRVITLSSIQDSGGTANGGVDVTSLSIASTITIVAVNDAPIVTTSGGNTTYTEGTAAVVDAALTVSDPDNTTLASATVAITGDFQSGQDVLEFTNNGTTMGNITAAYNAGAGMLTLSSAGSSATLAQWQSALSAVKYDNSSQNPSTANRTISFKVHDGGEESVAATKTVSVIAVNDAPVAVDDYVTLLEDVPVVGNVLTNDSDPEGNALTASLVTAPVNGTVVLNANGSFTYTPNMNYAGRDSLQYQVCDNGVPSKCNTAWLHLTINPVNDEPSITYLASRIVQEDEITALAGITFSDVDAGAGTVTVTLSVPSGRLDATTASGVTVTGTPSSLILNGSINDINAFIIAGAIKYIPVSNATGDVPLTIAINDNGNTGSGGALTVQVTQTLKILAVNDAPVNVVPGAQSVDQDATLVFNSANSNMISISDVDAGSSDVQVNLVATNGRMTLGSTSGLLFSVGTGTNDASLTFKGTIVNINNALNGLVFRPTSGYNGPASLQIITDDLGNSGSGGAKTDTDNIAITVNSISPKVISVSASTANGTYKVDDVIALTVTFDQTVMVNTSGGIPTLLLETGAIDRMSTYVSGDGSNTLTFNYTVQPGDVSADLDYQSTAALSLNGSSIKNIHDNLAILTLPVVGSSNSIAGQRAIVIDGVVPTVTSVAVPTNGYYLLNQNLDFTVNFSEAVLVNTVGGTLGLSLTIGGQAVYANYLSGSGSTALEFRYVVLDGLEDHDGIAVDALSLNGAKIRDAAGNDADLTLKGVGSTLGVKVDSKAPQVTLSINNGAIYTNNRTVTLDLQTTDADLSTMEFSNDNISWSTPESFVSTKSWDLTAGDGTKTVYVRVKDLGGNSTEVSDAIILDQTAPIVTGVINGGLYNNNRVITFNEGTATLNTVAFSSGSSVTADDTYVIVVTDDAGNTTTVTFTIDQTAPIVTGVENGKSYNNNRTITFNEGTATLNGATFVAGSMVSQEGTYVLVVSDDAGNMTTVGFSIDKTAPIVTGVENNKSYNTDRTITFNEGEATLNGALFTSGTVVTGEAVYTLVVTDAAGNSTTVGFTIDKTPPAVPANFIATGKNGQVSLAWSANMEPDFEKYILYVKPEGGVKIHLTDVVKGIEIYTYAGLPNGKTYEFYLVAVDQIGNTSAEALASAKTMGEQSISFAALTDLTYGQQGVALTASATSNLPVSFTSSDPAVAEVYQDNNDGGKWKVNAKKVGTVTITATQAGNNEYLPAAAVGNSLSIVPALLTVTADAKAKVYGESDPALTYTVKASDLRNGDAVSVVTGTITRVIGESVGSYDINNVDLIASNYNIIYEKAKLTITQASLTVTADAKAKVYGESDPVLTYTVKSSDLRNGDAASVVTGTITRVMGESVGNYDITNVDLVASNYNIIYEKAKLTITQASLTVTADAKAKVYGESDPALTYTVKASDLRNGDAASVVTGTMIRVMGESVGSYDINNVDLTASNYNIIYEKAKLTITQALLTVTADAKTKVYGESDPVLTYTVKASDLRNGDVASVVTGKVSRIAGEDVGSYTIGQGNLSAGGNYNIRYVGADLKITKATLSGLKFVNKEVVYDGTAKSIQLDGKLPIGVTVSYQNNDKINAGRYEVKAVIAETPNYFGETFTATLLIRKAKQTITFMTPEVLGRDAGKVALDVQSNSGLPVTLTEDDPMVATVSGTELHVHRLGTVHITAMQSGNENYEAASPVTVSVRVANDASAPLPIRVHQALSPNGDGINEFLIIEGIRDYTDNKVTIFDKNGSVLAEIEGYDNRDKVFFGRDHRDGTYFYYIDVKDNGVWKREKGYFVIRR